jgi:hypothetical protein
MLLIINLIKATKAEIVTLKHTIFKKKGLMGNVRGNRKKVMNEEDDIISEIVTT